MHKDLVRLQRTGRNYEKGKLEAEFAPTENGIVWMKFVESLPLLITGDQDGNIVVWDIKSQNNQYNCLYHVKNKGKDKKETTATSCDCLYDSVTTQIK